MEALRAAGSSANITFSREGLTEAKAREKNQKQEFSVTGEEVARKIAKESCRRGEV